MRLRFEWDEEKAKKNLNKHGVDFDEAATVFADSFSITIHDPDHSADEQRYIDIGISAADRLLVVVYAESDSIIRIISCRKATRSERVFYEENNG